MGAQTAGGAARRILAWDDHDDENDDKKIASLWDITIVNMIMNINMNMNMNMNMNG